MKRKYTRVAATFRLDDVTHNQIEWLTRFCQELSVPSITQRMIVARAIDYYLDYAEDLLISYRCKPKDKDVLAEIRELMEASKTRASVFQSKDLPVEDRAEGSILESYSMMIRLALSGPKPSLPGLRLPKNRAKHIEQQAKENLAKKKNTQ